jgi:hypothetical protein
MKCIMINFSLKEYESYMEDVLLISTNNYTRSSELDKVARNKQIPLVEVDNKMALNIVVKGSCLAA